MALGAETISEVDVLAGLGDAFVAEAKRPLLPGMPTRDNAEPAWRDHGEVVAVDSLDGAHRLADTYASEHVQILTARPRRALEQMRNCGALFLGRTHARAPTSPPFPLALVFLVEYRR